MLDPRTLPEPPAPPADDALESLCSALADLAYDVAVARMNEQEDAA